MLVLPLQVKIINIKNRDLLTNILEVSILLIKTLVWWLFSRKTELPLKKNLWEKSTGVITGFRTLPRITIISITYILENGKRVDAEFDVIPIGAVPYLQKEGEEVDISYSRRNPKKIDILSNKTGIIMGIFILCIAIAGTYIMIFEL